MAALSLESRDFENWGLGFTWREDERPVKFPVWKKARDGNGETR